MSKTILGTDYKFPGQTGVYHGKVRDVYTIGSKYLAIVATDRISAFDVVLPKPIPYKGQVLNQLAAHFLKETKQIAPNWFIDSPDPNASIGYKCDPFKIEVVIRAMLVGHAWREYKTGNRTISGVEMPDGMQEYSLFPAPIITPSTKSESGHDEDISAEKIIKQGLATQDQLDEIYEISLKLFARGQLAAKKRGLILADTKYELGLSDGNIMVIDEIHTPDSSRYFYEDSYNDYIAGKTTEKPKHLSKEFVREWLLKNGFSGQAGQDVPEMTDKVVENISKRYLELYEALTGQMFAVQETANIEERIENNVTKALGELR